MIKRFDAFYSDDTPTQKAGIVLKLGDKILVAHSTNSSWRDRPFGIPKGTIEPGEEEKSAAIREFYEEIGILLDREMLGPAESLTLYSSSGKAIGVLAYFVVEIESTLQLGLMSEVIPKSMLQLKEVDWAGFIKIDELYEKLYKSQLIILDRLR
jgi:predicted NUDIX family NTP pyrophosphohydrolase